MAKTSIAFASGFDRPAPAEAKAHGLTHRFAVIQETYRPDSADMVFDAPLYRALVAFAEAYEPDVRVSIDGAPEGGEDEPAAHIVARRADDIVLWIETEFWHAVGGPAPYHDSYTYAVYARDEVGARLRQYLAAHEASAGWTLASDVIAHAATPPPSVLQRLFGKRRDA
ncbi:MAG TPA: hypothetical protein VG943_16440 [Caulobacterales bacterium]|nr:hypothetical protein [Caulobacterales bacterium]